MHNVFACPLSEIVVSRINNLAPVKRPGIISTLNAN